MYRKYAADYEITVDREEVLKTMCKTSIKMNEALDTGDITAFKNLAAVFDQLRKSAKFTEAQKKDETVKYLDSIGELVAFCEQEGGIIDQYPLDPVKYPQDKVDFTLRDLKSYTYNLVTNELGLGDLIESYISKLEKAEKDSENSLDQGLITSAEEASAEEITDEEAESFQNFLEDQVEQDADSLFKMLGLER